MSRRPSTNHRDVLWAITTLLVLILAGCGGGSDGPGAEGADACAGGTGCAESCSPGNDLGVGMFCSPGGGECANTPSRAAPFCTADQRPEEDWFCTRPCDPNGDPIEQCGLDAACMGDGNGSPAGCVPSICLP